MLDNFYKALREYEDKMTNPYDEYDYIPRLDEEDPEVDRRLEDRDEQTNNIRY